MPSCAIDLRQRLFRCSHCEKKIVSETREKRLQKYLVSESWGAPLFLTPEISHNQILFTIRCIKTFLKRRK